MNDTMLRPFGPVAGEVLLGALVVLGFVVVEVLATVDGGDVELAVGAGEEVEVVVADRGPLEWPPLLHALRSAAPIIASEANRMRCTARS